MARPAGESGRVRFRLTVPAGTRLQRDQLAVEVVDAAGLEPGELVLPPSVSDQDPLGGVPRAVDGERVQLNLPVAIPHPAPGRKDMTVRVLWQGCGEGICCAPAAQTFNVPVRVSPKR